VDDQVGHQIAFIQRHHDPAGAFHDQIAKRVGGPGQAEIIQADPYAGLLRGRVRRQGRGQTIAFREKMFFRQSRQA